MNGNDDFTINVGNNLAEKTCVIRMEATVDELIASVPDTLEALIDVMPGKPPPSTWCIAAVVVPVSTRASTRWPMPWPRLPVTCPTSWSSPSANTDSSPTTTTRAAASCCRSRASANSVGLSTEATVGPCLCHLD